MTPSCTSYRGLLTGLLLVTLFTLPALSPLWNLTLPQSYDGLHRLHRLIEFDQAVRHGVFFPRWIPDVVHGYGYPLFNYFPYAHYYLPELLHLLGLSFSQALAAAFLLYTLLAAYGGYLLARDLFGAAPALLAALVYVYAPYQLHNSLVRGDLPEQFGLALFPLVLWAFRRLACRGTRRWFIASVVLYAVFLLSHNVLSLMFTPLLAVYAVGMGLVGGRRASWWERGRPVMALLLGCGLAAFFLLPAFFEKGWVPIGQALEQIADYRRFFLSLQELFGPPPPASVRLLHRPDYEALGWAQTALALPGVLLAGWRLDREARTWVSIATSILAGSIYAALPQSAWLWERVPLMSYILYPSRFLSLSSLALSLLAAGTVAAVRPERHWRPVVLATGAMGVVLLALPLLYPHTYPPQLISRNVSDILAYETRTGLLGTSSYGEYLPLSVRAAPTDSPLLPAYQAGQRLENIERFDTTSLPAGGRVLDAQYGFNRTQVTVSSPRPFLARFHTFYFPGWKATVNGGRFEPAPYGPLGLISLDVPAGESQLRLWFGDTPWRTAGKVLSLVSAGLLLTLVLKRDLWAPEQVAASEAGAGDRLRVGWRSHVLLLALLALGLLAFKLAYVDRYDSPFRRQGFDGVRVEEAKHTLDVSFGDQVNLLGYDFSADVLHPGQETELTLYWSQRQRLTRRPRVVLALVNPATGDALPQAAGWVPQDYPLEFWELELCARGVHRVAVPADARPGRYQLTVGLVHESSGDNIGETATLTAIKVPLPALDIQLGYSLDLRLGREIALVGYDMVKDDRLSLTLAWQCLSPPADDYTVFVHLLDGNGAIVAQADGQPRGGAYPTSIWSPGEVVPDEFDLAIEGLPPGDYDLAVGLYLLATGDRLPMTGADGQRWPDDRLLLPVSLP
jgi:hypothetical protein